MDKQIKAKLDGLMKYVPFIDFIAKMDSGKYAKFIVIKKWIINKTRYPLSDLNKIEQSIITQYKNLLVLDDKKMPQEIVQIFADEKKLQYVNLCSDDEEANSTDDIQNNTLKKSEDLKNGERNVDLEIVSIACPEKQKVDCKSKSPGQKKESCNMQKENSGVHGDVLNDITVDLLRQIDQVSDEDRKSQDCNVENKLVQRRTSRSRLIKRRDEFENSSKQNDINETDGENKTRRKQASKRRHSKVSPSRLVDIISLASSDEESSHPATNNHKKSDVLDRSSAAIVGDHDKTRSSNDKREHPDTDSASSIPPSTNGVYIEKISECNLKDQNEVRPSNDTVKNDTSDSEQYIQCATNSLAIFQPVFDQHPLKPHSSGALHLEELCHTKTVPESSFHNDRKASTLQEQILNHGTSVQNSSSSAEDKHRKAEEQLRAVKEQEVERKRQEDQSKRKEALKDIQKSDAKKKADEILSLLLPYEGEIASIWEQHRKPINANIKKKIGLGCISGEKENADDVGDDAKSKKINDTKEKDIDKSDGCTDIYTEPDKPNKGIKGDIETNVQQLSSKKCGVVKEPSKRGNEEKTRIDRINRVRKELKCTFKDYEQIQDYIPKVIGSKRRSSVHARTAIAEQLYLQTEDSFEGTDCTSSQSSTQSFVGVIGGKRRSSIYARSTIAELLNSETFDSLDSSDISYSQSPIESSESTTSKRRRTIDEPPNSLEGKQTNVIVEELNGQPDNVINMQNTPSSHSNASKRSKTNDELHSIEKKSGVSDESESESVLNDFEKFRLAKIQKQIIENQPMVVLKRLSEDQIKEHTNRCETIVSPNILNVHLIESRSQPDTTHVVTKKSSDAKNALPKRSNNDSSMTENSTAFCTLCSSRPSNLTNHYLRIHKSESYVSRLTWSQLDELSVNTLFAKVLPDSNSRVIRYSVTCPFCDVELQEPFMNLYNHYSTHTGEYAFECSGCQLQKPFRTDIHSHQLHTKKCRSSHVQTMYRYPANTMVIYLHYCIICNFVQLNEANILRHLRDHHDPRQSTPNNVKKCILVAITDGPPDASNESRQNESRSNSAETIQEDESNSEDGMSEVVAVNELHLKLDDDIPVCNEACSEEPFDSSTCLLEEQLKQIHEDPAVKLALPMSGPHLDPNGFNTESAMTPPRFGSRQVSQIYKPKLIETHDNCLVTPPRPSLQKLTINHSSSKSTYRPYPSNVKYMGLYKCMADDCYYSTDTPDEILKHLEDHGRENMSSDYLQCPYCSAVEGAYISSNQLVDHIRTKHLHMIYQCSTCCYRSCEASNVLVHQKENHPCSYQACNVFKCPGIERQHRSHYIKEKILENVRKIQCQYCSHKSFYHSNLLEHHINTDHKLNMLERLMNYSCIYCPLTEKDESLIVKHVAIKHPEEFPYICGHNNTVSVNEDLLHNLQSLNLAQPVPVIEVDSVADPIHPVEDVKPSAEELLKCQEETVKVRLRKLTEKTGVAPDCLYHCPEQSCGGFFTIFDLWLRHMRVKHHSLECQCPHCPTQSTRSLENYNVHFEEHRRHTYICFHCPQTFANYQMAVEHASRDHAALGSIRFEQIRFNISYSYFVLIKTEILAIRSEFMLALFNTLSSRLKEQYTKETKNLKRCWLVSTNSSPWLEDYEKDISRKLKKKCFNSSCAFRATENESLYKHVRENHNINGSSFNCSHCDFHLHKCQQWDDVLSHVKQHSDSSFFICGSCVNIHYSRSKVSSHIRKEHPARDVPIINLIRKSRRTYLSLAVVFANECLSFSTLRNCFCCEERGMKGDAFILHLKRYHKFVLNYFCEWCNLPIDSLQAAEEHYKLVHTKNKLKIRCELASKNDVYVVSLHNLEVHIDSAEADERLLVVKPELSDNPDCDDSVIILEDDDIVAEMYVRDQEKIEINSEKPKLKCIALTNLLKPTTPDPPSSPSDHVVSRDASIFPRIKIVPTRNTNTHSLTDSNNPTSSASLGFTQQQVAAPPPSRITNAITTNNMISNGYASSAVMASLGDVDQGLHKGKSVYSHPHVPASTSNEGNSPQQQVSVPRSISTNAIAPTSNSVITIQYGPASTGDGHFAKNATVTQPLSNDSSTYSHPQLATNIDKSFSVTPTVGPTPLLRHIPIPSAVPAVASATYQNNHSSIVYASTTIATCFLNSQAQANAVNEINPDPAQNISTLGGKINHQQHIEASSSMSGIANQQQTAVQYAMNGMTMHTHPQQHMSAQSTISGNNNHNLSTLSGLPNHTQHTPGSYTMRRGLTNQSQHIATPSTLNGMGNHPQHIAERSTMSGMKNHAQHIGGPSTNHPQYIVGSSMNHRQHIRGPSTNLPPQMRGSPSTNHPQHLTQPSTISGTKKHATEVGDPPTNQHQHIGAPSANHPQHIRGTSSNHPPQMRESASTNHLQYKGTPLTISRMKNHGEPSTNQHLHIGASSTNHHQHIGGTSTNYSPQISTPPSINHPQHIAEPYTMSGTKKHTKQIGEHSSNQHQYIGGSSTNHPQHTSETSIYYSPQIHTPPTINHPQHIAEPSTMGGAKKHTKQIGEPSTNHHQNICGSSTNHPQHIGGTSTNHPQHIGGTSTNHPQHVAGPSTMSGMQNRAQHIGEPSTNRYIGGTSSNHHPHIHGQPNHQQYVGVTSTMRGMVNHPQNIPESSTMNGMKNYPQHKAVPSTNHPQYAGRMTNHPQHIPMPSTISGMPNQLHHFGPSSTMNSVSKQAHHVAASTTMSDTTNHAKHMSVPPFIPESTISRYQYMSLPCESTATGLNNVAISSFGGSASSNTNATFTGGTSQMQTLRLHGSQYATVPTATIAVTHGSSDFINIHQNASTSCNSSKTTYNNGQY